MTQGELKHAMCFVNFAGHLLEPLPVEEFIE